MNKIDKKNIKKISDFFKILDLHKISDLTANHVSILASNHKSFFTNQHKYLFSQVNPKNLINVNFTKAHLST